MESMLSSSALKVYLASGNQSSITSHLKIEEPVWVHGATIDCNRDILTLNADASEFVLLFVVFFVVF